MSASRKILTQPYPLSRPSRFEEVSQSEASEELWKEIIEDPYFFPEEHPKARIVFSLLEDPFEQGSDISGARGPPNSVVIRPNLSPYDHLFQGAPQAFRQALINQLKESNINPNAQTFLERFYIRACERRTAHFGRAHSWCCRQAMTEIEEEDRLKHQMSVQDIDGDCGLEVSLAVREAPSEAAVL